MTPAHSWVSCSAQHPGSQITMQTMADLQGIYRRGIATRQAGKDFDDNPFYSSSGSLEEWHECASSWADGWLDEDAGRDKAVQARFRVWLW
jgi:hypothetical protein